MRALAYGIFAVAVACGSPAREPETRFELPRRQANPDVPKFPDARRVWSGRDYRSFLRALDRVPGESLPRASDPTFARVIANDNLRTIRDRSRPYRARLEELGAVMSVIRATSERYFEAHTSSGGFDREFLRVHAFHLGLVALSWELLEEAAAARGEARGEVQRATAALLLQLATILAHRDVHAAENLVAFIDQSRSAIAKLTRRVAPDVQLELTLRLAELATKEAHAGLAERLRALAKILGSADLVIGPATTRVDASPRDSLVVIDVAPTTVAKIVMDVISALSGRGGRAFRLRTSGRPLEQLRARPGSGRADELAVLVASGGVGLKTRAGNIAPGCAGLGPGLSVPKRGGKHDLDALSVCVERVVGETGSPEVTLHFSGETTFEELLSVASALPRPDGDAPEVVLRKD